MYMCVLCVHNMVLCFRHNVLILFAMTLHIMSSDYSVLELIGRCSSQQEGMVLWRPAIWSPLPRSNGIIIITITASYNT